MRLGKNVYSAIDAGYKRAFVTILDANIVASINNVEYKTDDGWWEYEYFDLHETTTHFSFGLNTGIKLKSKGGKTPSVLSSKPLKKVYG